MRRIFGLSVAAVAGILTGCVLVPVAFALALAIVLIVGW